MNVSSLRNCLPLALAATLAACEGSTGSNTPGAQSTFDADADGWTVVGDAQPVQFVSSGGNPGGYVSTSDLELGGTWYWKAPQKFLQSLSGAYGGRLRFDLIVSQTGNGYEDVEVVLTGGDTRLGFDLPSAPGTRWTSYEVDLSERGAWVDLATNRTASRSQIRAALRGASELRIRGEFRDGPDTGGLDNVYVGR